MRNVEKQGKLVTFVKEFHDNIKLQWDINFAKLEGGLDRKKFLLILISFIKAPTNLANPLIVVS